MVHEDGGAAASVVPSEGRFKYTYEHVNIGVLKSSRVNTLYIFQCMGKNFVWNFKGYIDEQQRDLFLNFPSLTSA